MYVKKNYPYVYMYSLKCIDYLVPQLGIQGVGGPAPSAYLQRQPHYAPQQHIYPQQQHPQHQQVDILF